jgi:flagellar hook-associated protein 3 FlgL
MRVTDRMGYEQVTRNLQKNRSDMAELQNQAATQKKVTKPSDDPIASARVLGSRTEERGSAQFIKNMNVARSFLEFSDQSLGELSEILMRLKELAIQQSNDAGASDETRRVVAEEVAQIFNQAVQIGNRKLGERYIFGGHRTTSAPFTQGGDYQGDDGDLKIHVNKDAFVAMNIPGDRVFLGRGIGDDGIIRPRPETPKTTDELIKYQNDERRREEENRIRETEPKELRSPAGATARDQKIVETKPAETDGAGINILQTIKDFEVSLRVNDKAEIQAAIDSIDRALSQVIHARAQVGARLQVLTHTTDSLQKAIVDNKMVASQLEDADLFQVASDIAKNDSTLKATLETSGKVVQPSLLDFLK